MRYVKSLPPESGMPGSPGKPTTRSSELRQKLRRSICCVLIGTMLLGTGAPGSLAMDGNNSPWPLNKGNEGELTPDSIVTVRDNEGNQASCSATCTLSGVVGNSVAALAQEAGPSYRPTGAALHKIWQDIMNELFMAGGVIAASGYKQFSASTNLVQATGIQGVAAVGAFGAHTLRAYSHFALTQFLAKLKKPDGTPRFTDIQVSWIAAFFNTACKLGIAAASGYVSYKADDWAKDPERRRKILSGDLDGLGHGEAGNRTRDNLIAMDKAYISGPNLVLPTPIGTSCPSQVVELPKVEFGSDNPVTFRHWSFGQPLTPIIMNSNTLASFPVKLVADGDRHWMLANKEPNGFNIYRMLQFSSSDATLAHIDNWTKIPGQAIDLFPGPNFVFAINKDKDVFQCAWPCNTGNWSNMNIKAVSVAVGPRMVSTTNPDTTGQPVFVWVKDSHGHVSRRLERFPGGLWHRVNNRADIPPRIRALLDERDTYDSWVNWHLRYKYPALRR